MCLAVPGLVTEIDSGSPMMRVGRVSFGGIFRKINLVFVPEAEVGDYVLVHVGFAISKINHEEAQKVFALLDQLEAPQ